MTLLVPSFLSLRQFDIDKTRDRTVPNILVLRALISNAFFPTGALERGERWSCDK